MNIENYCIEALDLSLQYLQIGMMSSYIEITK